MSGEVAIAARGIRHRYDRRIVLDLPSLDVPAGGCVALVGPNGAGKTTLLRILALLERPSEGAVTLLGRPAWQNGHRRRGMDGPELVERRRQVTLVHQKPLLLSTTVRANVAFGLRARGLSGSEAERRAAAALEEVGMGGFARRSSRDLSGGEIQRVALARALVLETPILLLDEPTSSLDADAIPLVERALRRRLDRGIAVVVSTHHRPLVSSLDARRLRLVAGRPVA